MKTFCGISRYKTLPNKYKSSAYSSSKESSPPILQPILYTLPPRPRVSRSASFSESQTRNYGESHPKQKSHNDSEKDVRLPRTQSVHRLQGPSYNQMAHTSPTPCSKCHHAPRADHNTHTQLQPRQFQPLSRSLSLASLQPPQLLTTPYNPKHDDRSPPDHNTTRLHTRAPSIGHIYQNTKTDHAGIWSRGRRAESCRNLSDLSDHDGTCKLWGGSRVMVIIESCRNLSDLSDHDGTCKLWVVVGWW